MANSKNIRRIGVLSGGGDCPGLNAVIRAVTKTASAGYAPLGRSARRRELEPGQNRDK